MKGPPKYIVPEVIFPPEVKLMTTLVKSGLSCRVLKMIQWNPFITDIIGNQHFVLIVRCPYLMASGIFLVDVGYA